MDISYFDIMARAQKSYSRLLEPVCRKWDLTRNELDVLLFLANNPEYDRAADIVRHRGMSKGHVSLSVSNLETRGLIHRKEDSADHRTVHLELAEAAGEIAEEGRKAQHWFFSCLFRGVTPEQLGLMADLARKTGENIKNIEKNMENSSK